MSGKTTATRNTTRARVGSTARLAAAMNLNKKSLASGSIIEQFEKNNASRKELQNKRSNLASAVTLSTANIGNRNAKAIKRRANALQNGSTEEHRRLNAENADAKVAHKELEEEYKNLSDSLAKAMHEYDEKFDTTLMKANLLGLKQEYENNKDKNNEQTTKQLQMYLTRAIESFKLYIQRNPTVGSKIKDVLFKMLSSGNIDKNDISDPKVKDLVLFIIPLLKLLRPFIFRVLPYSDDFEKYSETIDDLSEQAEAIEKGIMQGGYKVEITPNNVKKFYMFRYGRDRFKKSTLPIVLTSILVGVLFGIVGGVFGGFLGLLCTSQHDSSKIQGMKDDWVKQKIEEIKKERKLTHLHDEEMVRKEIIEKYNQWKKASKESYKNIIERGKGFYEEFQKEKEERKHNPVNKSSHLGEGQINPMSVVTAMKNPHSVKADQIVPFQSWEKRHSNKVDAIFNKLSNVKNPYIRDQIKGKIQIILDIINKKNEEGLTDDKINTIINEIEGRLDYLITYKNPDILNNVSHISREYRGEVEPKLNKIITTLQYMK